MEKYSPIYIIFIFLVLTISQPIWAEQVERDMFAAVVVNPIFTLSLDNANVNFGYVEPGSFVELNPDTHYNFVKCNSNKGKTWYLKISIMGDVSGPAKSIPPEAFKWQISQAIGDGTAVKDWQKFTSTPKVAYTSGLKDNSGEDVIIRFKYRLDLPGNAAAGYYNTRVMYTMTDIP